MISLDRSSQQEWEILLRTRRTPANHINLKLAFDRDLHFFHSRPSACQRAQSQLVALGPRTYFDTAHGLAGFVVLQWTAYGRALFHVAFGPRIEATRKILLESFLECRRCPAQTASLCRHKLCQTSISRRRLPSRKAETVSDRPSEISGALGYIRIGVVLLRSKVYIGYACPIKRLVYDRAYSWSSGLPAASFSELRTFSKMKSLQSYNNIPTTVSLAYLPYCRHNCHTIQLQLASHQQSRTDHCPIKALSKATARLIADQKIHTQDKMPSSQQKATRKAGKMAKAFFGIINKSTRGISAIYDKIHRAPVDACTPDTTTQKSRLHVRGPKPRPRQKLQAPAPGAAPSIAKEKSFAIENRPGHRPAPEASETPQNPRRGNQLDVIRDESRIRKSFREEASSPDWSIHIPRRRPHGYQEYSRNSACVPPLDTSRKQSSVMPSAESARIQQSVATYPGGQARVITVIRSDPSRRSGCRNSSRRGQYHEENTPLSYSLSLQQYHLRAFAKQVRIVKPFVPTENEKSRMGRVNHRVRIRRAPSVQSHKAIILTEEALEEDNAVAAPVDEYSPVSVEQRCNDFLDKLEADARPDQPENEAIETSQPGGNRTDKDPSPDRGGQQSRSQSPRDQIEAAETEKSELQLIPTAKDSVLEEGWSSDLLDLLKEEKSRSDGLVQAPLAGARQTSLIPGRRSSEVEENDLSGDSFGKQQHSEQRIHRHDSTQLQGLLQPKRGYEVRAVQDPRYPRVVSLERRVTNPDVASEERPAWTKIGHHAILSSWQQQTEPKTWMRSRQPSYDVSGMHTLPKSRADSMANWTDGAIDAVLRRSMDGVVDGGPGLSSQLPPPASERKERLWADEWISGGKGEAEGSCDNGKRYAKAVRSRFVEHLQENAELLESLGVEGEWKAEAEVVEEEANSPNTGIGCSHVAIHYKLFPFSCDPLGRWSIWDDFRVVSSLGVDSDPCSFAEADVNLHEDMSEGEARKH
ncbi:uncharacterized protein MYCFIDRAFT_170155 [Pseudocercospora fijiensis CIRAD86]|uniref:Uncharacterized protein n=1 Tax=Pseudocercospora fijiensis (strain CIRAD86) TaxID=383855 RepID=N1Q9R8_PSEFD|nr:uncharacterized protein MYCFIDRAFT_170155 [Pseudocercospora fijiensis CIRAD86]EME88551.1 hypothetical protein MYCFIDRAFT_170155 [Pseudocercospora fijiensis CIRAD86]